MHIFADLRYASRQLLKNPTFTVVSLLSLALGIGAATAVFSVIYGVLLHPFPYQGADRMISLRLTGKAGYNGFTNYLLLSARQFQDLEKADVLDGAIATDNWDMSATGQDIPEAIHTGKLSANAFQYFGVPAILGREFTPSDGAFGEEPQRVVILSYSFWQSHFGGSATALGKTFQLDRENYTIIGVTPPSFTWFHSDVYIPLRLTNDADRVSMIDARLKPGITPAAAQTRLEPLIENFAKESPKHFPRGARLQVSPLNAGTEKRFQGTLMALFAAVTLLLAVGCANVSILLLGRVRTRQHELAVRSAIGASRARIVRQLLTEALLLAALGCATGVILAYRGVPLLLGWLPDNSFPNSAAIHVNGPVLLFSILIAFSTGILFGVWPALRSTQPRATAGSVQGRRLHRILIASQVSLTVLLLAGAGASVRTFLRLYQSPLGFDPQHVLIVSLQFPDGTHTQLDERQNFYSAVRRKIAALPGVESAAIYPFGLPPEARFARQLEIFDRQDSKGRSVYANPVSREFFEALRIPILQGRTWSEQETSRAAHIAIVNRAFARRYWPNANALGRKIRLPDFTAFTTWMLAHPGSNDWLEVVGVAGDTPNDGLSRPIGAAVYVPYTLVLGDSFNLAIRTYGNPRAIARAVRRAVHAVSAGQPVNEIRTAEEILAAEGWSTEKFIAALFLLFAGLALALAAIGLYSVVSFAVTERNREFGIRMALGAPRASILKLVLSSGIRAVAFGLMAGLFLCVISNSALRHWTQSSMYDPGVILPVSVLLFLVMIPASFRPAWRASTLDPIKALRDEVSS